MPALYVGKMWIRRGNREESIMCIINFNGAVAVCNGGVGARPAAEDRNA